MKQNNFRMLLAAPFLLAIPCLSYAQGFGRELHVVVEVDAEQTWSSETEEFGSQYSLSTSKQRYELRMRLRADGELYSLNVLDLDQKKRLKAKTIHLARQAKKRLDAVGKTLVIPETPEQKQDLIRQMQEAQYACKGDAVCLKNTVDLYAAIFAAMQYPEAFQEDPGPGRYRYYEPYPDCTDTSRVTMELKVEGEHYNKGEKKVVPFTQTRSADTQNPKDDIPICQRFLAVIDTQNEEQPLYWENFYLPSATGETISTELGHTLRKTERQPMIDEVLGWVTGQLRHAPESGAASGEVRFVQALNGVSEGPGSSNGLAKVKMRWNFAPAEPVE